MKKATKIKRSPKIVQAIEHAGCETLYWIGSYAYVSYEDSAGVLEKRYDFGSDGKLYRKVESSDHPGAEFITITTPDFNFVKQCYEPIEEENT